MIMQNQWKKPQEFPELHQDEIHVWLLKVNHYSSKKLLQLLNKTEKQRAQRFAFAEHKEKFIITHGVLRILLSHYLRQDPKTIKFTHNKQGKPAIPNSELEFNISHSGDLALFAFAKNIPIGVDVEAIKPKIEYEDIAKRFFSPTEYEQLLQIPTPTRKTAFFNCWTRKEAFIKAIGEGLSFPLSDFDVSVQETKPSQSQLLKIHKTYNASDWSVLSLDVPGKHTAAIACSASASVVKINQYNCNKIFPLCASKNK